MSSVPYCTCACTTYIKLLHAISSVLHRTVHVPLEVCERMVLLFLRKNTCTYTSDACYHDVTPHLFSEVPQFGNLRPLPRTDLERNKIATADAKSHGLGTRRESCRQNDPFPTVLGSQALSFKNYFKRKVLHAT